MQHFTFFVYINSSRSKESPEAKKKKKKRIYSYSTKIESGSFITRRETKRRRRNIQLLILLFFGGVDLFATRIYSIFVKIDQKNKKKVRVEFNFHAKNACNVWKGGGSAFNNHIRIYVFFMVLCLNSAVCPKIL